MHPPSAAGTRVARTSGADGLRRLTRAQLENSLRDLLGEVDIPGTEPDAWQEGFASIGAARSAVSASGVEQYEQAIGSALEQAFASPSRAALLGCAPSGPADAACMKSFVGGFGRRAWRGKIDDAAVARFTELGLAIARDLGDFHAGARHAAWGLLQSPEFLYRVELATIADPADRGRRRYGSGAMASRLSYLLWNTTPDAELLAAADRDELTAAAGVRAQAERLLNSPRAAAALGNFAAELFHLHRLSHLPKDAKLFPSFTPSLRAAMADEITSLYGRLVQRDIDGRQVFDTQEVTVAPELAKLYGLGARPTGSGAFTATLPSTDLRAGVLGTAGILALHAKQNETSPTARGKLVREVFLCQTIPDPPPTVDTALADPPAGVVLTMREKFERHRADPACQGCHALLDPAGLALEIFDPIGAFRASDHGKPIDGSGALDGQRFADARELGRLLRANAEARRCLVRQLFRYAVGHREDSAEEEILLATLDDRFVRQGGRVRALLLDLVSADAFRHAEVPR